MANMIDKGMDGASFKVGTHHSVYILLKHKQPQLQLIRCVSLLGHWLKKKSSSLRIAGVLKHSTGIFTNT